MSKPDFSKRVIVTRPFCGLCSMQVCAKADATDDEILAVCNSENPAGTTNGWGDVVRQAKEDSMFHTEDSAPGQCEDDPTRMHFIVLC